MTERKRQRLKIRKYWNNEIKESTEINFMHSHCKSGKMTLKKNFVKQVTMVCDFHDKVLF